MLADFGERHQQNYLLSYSIASQEQQLTGTNPNNPNDKLELLVEALQRRV